MKAVKGVFSHFGDMIHSLNVQFIHRTDEESKEILKAINDNSSSSLKKLLLGFCKMSVFHVLTNTFDQVNLLSFSIDSKVNFEYNDFNIRKLSQIFPNLEELTLLDAIPSLWTFVDGIFPKLVIFQVYFYKQGFNGINEISIANLLQKTPQMKSLKLIYNNQCDNPQSPSNRWSKIHFKNVQELLILSNNLIPDYIFFDQLKSLYLNIEYPYKAIEFIQRQNIDKINTFEFRTTNLTAGLFLTIPNILPKLHTVKIVQLENLLEISDDDVVNYIQKSGHLRDFSIISSVFEFNIDKISRKLNNYRSHGSILSVLDWDVSAQIASKSFKLFILRYFIQIENYV